jgi:hypothetical protein
MSVIKTIQDKCQINEIDSRPPRLSLIKQYQKSHSSSSLGEDLGRLGRKFGTGVVSLGLVVCWFVWLFRDGA